MLPVELAINPGATTKLGHTKGGVHVTGHNPHHYFDSRFDRRHSDVGTQQGLGLWAFGNCWGHSRDSPHIVAPGQDLASLPGLSFKIVRQKSKP